MNIIYGGLGMLRLAMLFTPRECACVALIMILFEEKQNHKERYQTELGNEECLCRFQEFGRSADGWEICRVRPFRRQSVVFRASRIGASSRRAKRGLMGP